VHILFDPARRLGMLSKKDAKYASSNIRVDLSQAHSKYLIWIDVPSLGGSLSS